MCHRGSKPTFPAEPTHGGLPHGIRLVWCCRPLVKLFPNARRALARPGCHATTPLDVECSVRCLAPRSTWCFARSSGFTRSFSTSTFTQQRVLGLSDGAVVVWCWDTLRDRNILRCPPLVYRFNGWPYIRMLDGSEKANVCSRTIEFATRRLAVAPRLGSGSCTGVAVMAGPCAFSAFWIRVCDHILCQFLAAVRVSLRRRGAGAWSMAWRWHVTWVDSSTL